MKRFLRIALMVVLVVVIGAASLLVIASWRSRREDPVLPRRALRPDVLGCYALFGEDGRRVDTTYYNASPLVELGSTPWRRMHDSLRVDSLQVMWRSLVAFDTLGAPSRTTRGLRPPDWSADSLSDSIRVSFVNGLSGAVFVLAAPAGHIDTLRGRALELWDFGPSETRRGSAHAIRVRCPSPALPPDDRLR